MNRLAPIVLLAASAALWTAGARAQPGADASKNKAAASPPTSPSDEAAQRAAAAAQAEKYTEALDLMRQAYRLDPTPRWLYDLAVLHDHLGECDDAAFFYRAAIWGKGVLPQDQAPVEARLATLEQECHYKKRHATAADRHQRAARYMGLKLCGLAKSILAGIATAVERAELSQCVASEKQ